MSNDSKGEHRVRTKYFFPFATNLASSPVPVAVGGSLVTVVGGATVVVGAVVVGAGAAVVVAEPGRHLAITLNWMWPRRREESPYWK
jgi:hypothetical protein